MELSIITCTYNSEIFLQEAIDSVISQKLNSKKYEHIFIDGFSTDATISIIQEYIRNYSDTNIFIEQKMPKGIYNALNEGIKLAKGKYILFLNSDDYLQENVLNDYLAFIEKNPDCDIFYAKFQQCMNGKIMGCFPKNNFFAKFGFKIGFNTLVYFPTCILKTTLFHELGLFDETKKIASDLGFWFLCLSKGKKFLFFDKIVSNFRVHPDSMTSNPANKHREIAEVSFFRKKYLGKLGTLTDFFSKTLIKIKLILSHK